MELKTEFADRDALVAYVKEVFPEVAARSPEVAPTLGGRVAAEQQLNKVDPVRYAATRNALEGAVTRLSPYIRHGVLSLGEVREYVLEKAGRDAEKLVNELAWRDYWQRVYATVGDGIWADREDYKTGFKAKDYAEELPADIRNANTKLNCMDSFVRELYETGYLHNHVRMWLAAYVVHFRRVRWQAGASWFLEHLLDGDPASNNLSWQWVASTFSHKAYYFDRSNLERNTGGKYCRNCPLARGGCPFDYSIDDLHAQLFPNLAVPDSDNDYRRGRSQNYSINRNNSGKTSRTARNGKG